MVFLKQLTSGLLLISGPYGVNGVPLRRINQKYVISTSTKIPVTGVDVSAIDDAFFAREKKSTKKSSDETLDEFNAKSTNVLTEVRKTAQTKIDTSLIANIKKIDLLESYLKAKFALKNGDKPHLLKF